MKKILTTSALAALSMFIPTMVEAKDLPQEELTVEATYDYSPNFRYQTFPSSDDEIETFYNPSNNNDENKEVAISSEPEPEQEQVVSNNEAPSEQEDFKLYYEAIQQRKDIFKRIEILNMVLKSLDLESKFGKQVASHLIENTKEEVVSICKSNPLLEEEFVLETQSCMYFIALDATMVTADNTNKKRVDYLYSTYFNESTIRQIKGY